jgi:hypothetical protein
MGAVPRDQVRAGTLGRLFGGLRPAELLLMAVLLAVMAASAVLLIRPGLLETMAGLPPASTITPGQGGPAGPDAARSPFGR